MLNYKQSIGGGVRKDELLEKQNAQQSILDQVSFVKNQCAGVIVINILLSFVTIFYLKFKIKNSKRIT